MNGLNNLKAAYSELHQKYRDTLLSENPDKISKVIKHQHSRAEYASFNEKFRESQNKDLPEEFPIFNDNADEDNNRINSLLGKFIHNLNFHHPFEENFCDYLNEKLQKRLRKINNPVSFSEFMKNHVKKLISMQDLSSSEAAEHKVYLLNLESTLNSIIYKQSDESNVVYDDKSNLLFEKIVKPPFSEFKGLSEEDSGFLFNSLIAKYRVNRNLKRLRFLSELIPISLETKANIPQERTKLFDSQSSLPSFPSFSIPSGQKNLILDINLHLQEFVEVSKCKEDAVSQFIFQLDKFFNNEFQKQSDVFLFPLYDSELMLNEADDEDPEGFIQKELEFSTKPRIKSSNNIPHIFLKAENAAFENELRSIPIKSTFAVFEWVRILLSSKIEETDSYIERKAAKHNLSQEFLYKAFLRILILKNRKLLLNVFEILNVMREIQFQINFFLSEFVASLTSPGSEENEEMTLNENESLRHLEIYDEKKGYKFFSLLAFVDDGRSPVSFQRTNPCFLSERNLKKTSLLKRIVSVNSRDNLPNEIFVDPLKVVDCRGFSIIHETALSDFLEFVATVKDYLNLYIEHNSDILEANFNFETAFLHFTFCESEFLKSKFEFLQELMRLLKKVKGEKVKKALANFICQIQAKRPQLPLFESCFMESYYLAIQNQKESTALLKEMVEHQNQIFEDFSRESVDSNERTSPEMLYPAQFDKIVWTFLSIQTEMEALEAKEMKLSHIEKLQLEILYLQEVRWIWNCLSHKFEIFDELSEVSAMDCDTILRSPNFFEAFKNEFGNLLKEKRSRSHAIQTSLRESGLTLKEDFLIDQQSLSTVFLDLVELLKKREKLLLLVYSMAYLSSIYNEQCGVLVPTRKNPISLHALLSLDAMQVNFSFLDLSSWISVLTRPKKFWEFQLYFECAVITRELFFISCLQNMFLVEDLFRYQETTVNTGKFKSATQKAANKFGINKFPQKIAFVDVLSIKKRIMKAAETLLRVTHSKKEGIQAPSDVDEVSKKLFAAAKQFDLAVQMKKDSIEEVAIFIKLLAKEIYFETLKVQTMMLRKRLFRLQNKIPLKNPLFTESFFPIFDEFGYATNIFNLPTFFSIFEYTHDDFDVEIIADLKEKEAAEEAIRKAQALKGNLRGSSKVKKSKMGGKLYSRKKFFKNSSLSFLEKTNLFLVYRFMTIVYGLLQVQFLTSILESYVEDILLMRSGLLKRTKSTFTTVEDVPPFKLQEIRLRNAIEPLEIFFERVKSGLEKFKGDPKIVNVNEAIMIYLSKKLNVNFSTMILMLFRMYDNSDSMVSTNFVTFMKLIAFPSLSKLTANQTALRAYDLEKSSLSTIEGILSSIFLRKKWKTDHTNIPRFFHSLYFKFYNQVETSFLLLSKSERTTLSTLSSELNGEINEYANKRNVFESKDPFQFLKKSAKFLKSNLRMKTSIEIMEIVYKGRNAFEKLGSENYPEILSVKHFPSYVITKKEFSHNINVVLDYLELLILQEIAFKVQIKEKDSLNFSVFSYAAAFLNHLYFAKTIVATEFRGGVSEGVALLEDEFFSFLSQFNEISIKKFMNEISKNFKILLDEFVEIEKRNRLVERESQLLFFQENQIRVLTKDVVRGRVGHKVPLALLELDDLQEKVESLQDQQDLQAHFLRQKLQESFFSTIRDLKFKQNNLASSFVEYKLDMSMTAKHFMSQTEKDFNTKLSNKANEAQGKMKTSRKSAPRKTTILNSQQRASRYSTIFPEEEIQVKGIENNPLFTLYTFLKKQRIFYQLKDIQLREEFERELIKKKESLIESENLRTNIKELEAKGELLTNELSEAQKKELIILKKNAILASDLQKSDAINKKLKKENLDFLSRTEKLVSSIENLRFKKTLKVK